MTRLGLLGPGGLLDRLAAAPGGRFSGIEVQVPVLMLPNVFEPEFCAKLTLPLGEEWLTETGFMRDVGRKWSVFWWLLSRRG